MQLWCNYLPSSVQQFDLIYPAMWTWKVTFPVGFLTEYKAVRLFTRLESKQDWYIYFFYGHPADF